MYYTMVYGTLPFYSGNERELVKMIKTENVKFPKDTPITPLGKQLIKDFLQKDPDKRIELIDFVT